MAGVSNKTIKELSTKYLDLETQPELEDLLSFREDGRAMMNMTVRAVFGNLLSIAAGGAFEPAESGLVEEEVDSKFAFREAFSTKDDNIEVVRLILELGVDPNTRGGLYETPLNAGVYTGRAEVVRLLLECGGSLDMEDEDGHIGYHGDVNHNEQAIERITNILDHILVKADYS